MIYVTMKDGTVRKYNNGRAWFTDSVWTTIGSEKPVNQHGIAKIRTEDIKMLEFSLPCSVTRVKKVGK